MSASMRFMDHLDARTLDRHRGLAEFASRVGGTPLIALPPEPGCARIFAKCEWENPSGTVKDRVAFAMVYAFLRDLGADDAARAHLLEYTGGSLGLSLSKLCRRLGIPLTLVAGSFLPAASAAELAADGTELELVDKEKGFYAVIERAVELARLHPDWTLLYQHENPANPWIHRETTGRELLAQLKTAGAPRLDAGVASIGTGGSLIGVYEAARSRFPDVRLYATTPSELPYASPLPGNGLPKFAGSGGLGDGRRQGFVEPHDETVARHFHYSFDETLLSMRAFSERTGLRVGTSAAANLAAAREVSRELGEGGCVATIFPSLATKDEWAKCRELPS